MNYPFQRGSVLLVTLGILSLCSLLVGLTISLIVSSHTISKETSLGNIRNVEMLDNLLQKQTEPKPNWRLACINTDSSKDQKTIEDCQISTTTLPITQYIDKHSPAFPVLNLETLIKELSICPLYQENSKTLLLGKYSSTPSSAFSNQDCIVNGTQSKPLVINRNIKSTLPLTLAQNSYLFAAGKTEITDSIRVEGDTFIVAGGDLAVKTLISESKGGIKVTLISLSGSVIVEKTIGAISLFVIAWDGAAVPSTPFNPPFRIPETLSAFLLNRNSWN